MQETKRIKNPKKQRKRLFNAPAHFRHKLMAAHLSSELAASKGAKTLPVRKGDTVRIERGDNKGFEGKVSRVDLSEYRIYLEGLTREKTDGTNIFLSVHPSKVQIRNLNLDDKRRKEILSRKKEIEKPEREEKLKAKAAKKAEKPKEKPEAKVEEITEKKPAEALAAKEETMPEVVEEQAPAAKKPATKKPKAKRSAAKKEAANEEAPVKEAKVPAKKLAAKKTATSKEAPAKGTDEKKTTPKPRAKRKISEEGGQ
jgi:large subunit ribosomal protein L24